MIGLITEKVEAAGPKYIWSRHENKSCSECPKDQFVDGIINDFSYVFSLMIHSQFFFLA